MLEDPLMLATRLRAHLVCDPPAERKRLVDAILEGLCRSCGMPEGHAFCDAEWAMSQPEPEDGYYESIEVAQERAPAEDKRDYAGYYCYVKGQPRTLEEWKAR